MDTVFYSWQSDLNSKTTRYFIEKALEKAVKLVRKEGLEVDPRIDQDARSASGSADIPAEIFRSIEKCRVFVGDVSIINQDSFRSTAGNLESILEGSADLNPQEIIKARLTPNPNVLIELGYAASSLGWNRVICVCNEAYGRVEDLPFDIRHRTIIKYNLPPETNDEVKQQQEEKLKGQLRGMLTDAIQRTEKEVAEKERLITEEKERRLAEERAKYPILDLQFFDPIQRKPVGKSFVLQCVIVKDPKPIASGRIASFLTSVPKILDPDFLGSSGINTNYRKEMKDFITLSELYRPLSFFIHNSGSVLATDVRVTITLPRSSSYDVRSWEEIRKPKYRRNSLFELNLGSPRSPDIWIRTADTEQIHICGQIEKIQPGQSRTCWSAFYITGTQKELVVEAKVTGDNLPTPMIVPMKITFTHSERTMSYEELAPPSRDED